MKTNILRCAALALGLFATSTALGQYSYPATGNAGGDAVPGNAAPGSAMPVHPSLRASAAGYAVGSGAAGQSNPWAAPGSAGAVAGNASGQPTGNRGAASPAPSAYPYAPPAYRSAANDGDSVVRTERGAEQPRDGQLPMPQPMPESGRAYGGWGGWGGAAPTDGYSSFSGATPAPVEESGAPMRNWFAGGGVMLFNVEDDSDRRLLFNAGMPSNTVLSTNDADFGGDTGYEFFLGRYVGAGQHAITFSFWGLDADGSAGATVPGAGGDYGLAMPMWDRAYVDIDGSGDETAGEDMLSLFNNATAYRICRESEFRNYEVNFVSFGLGGAARAACGGVGCGVPCGGCNSCNSPTATCVGGACGGIVPPCHSKLRLQTTHGLRWFEFNDYMQFAASTANPGYSSTHDDMYYIMNVENNLIGYQFGSRADYCVGKRFNLYAGGKVGLYANDVDFDSRLSSGEALAQVGGYYPSNADETVEACGSETALAFIGELDLGVGARITSCWSLRGGYRIISASGVATAPGQLSADPAHLAESGRISADKSVLLHGAYLGAEYNW